MSLFSCPICAQPLQRGVSAYSCPNRHSFDIAKEGYTYLLPPNQKHSSAPGDDKGMAAVNASTGLALQPGMRSSPRTTMRL